MAATQITKEEYQEFKEQFELLDKDKSGKISVTELGEVLKSLGNSVTNEELEAMVNEADSNADGEVDFDEFVKMVTARRSQCSLKDAFNVFDKDGSGFISFEELKQVMETLGEALSDEQVSEMLKEADEDSDGQVSYEEFVKMMSNK